MLYFASFGLIFIGVVIYTVNPPKSATDTRAEKITSYPDVPCGSCLLAPSFQNGPLPADISGLALDVGIHPHRTATDYCDDLYVSKAGFDCYPDSRPNTDSVANCQSADGEVAIITRL
jgi:hypothetical protein